MAIVTRLTTRVKGLTITKVHRRTGEGGGVALQGELASAGIVLAKIENYGKGDVGRRR